VLFAIRVALHQRAAWHIYMWHAASIRDTPHVCDTPHFCVTPFIYTWLWHVYEHLIHTHTHSYTLVHTHTHSYTLVHTHTHSYTLVHQSVGGAVCTSTCPVYTVDTRYTCDMTHMYTRVMCPVYTCDMTLFWVTRLIHMWPWNLNEHHSIGWECCLYLTVPCIHMWHNLRVPCIHMWHDSFLSDTPHSYVTLKFKRASINRLRVLFVAREEYRSLVQKSPIKEAIFCKRDL